MFIKIGTVLFNLLALMGMIWFVIEIISLFIWGPQPKVYVDELTGCQYFVTRNYIFPVMDETGNPLCNRNLVGEILTKNVIDRHTR